MYMTVNFVYLYSGPIPSTYRVYYTNLDDSSAQPKSKDTPTSSITLDNLQPFSNYEAFVVPVTPTGTGDKSKPIKFRTKGQGWYLK
jgi:Fibronectin type III domain.